MTSHRAARPDQPRRTSRPGPVRTALILVVVAALAALGIAVTASAASGHKKHQRHHHQVTASHTATKKTTAHLTAAPTHPKAAPNGVCGSMAATKASRVTHVIWIVMENRSYSQVIGAPYISSLARHCGVATNYHNVSHPSLPNYIAMTSGRSLAQLPSTDCPSFCRVSGPSIFTQTKSWRVYAESMPGHCVRHDAMPYVVHHTAAPYYSALTNCATNDVPLTAFNPNALPAFSMIIPNVRDDMHEKFSSVAAGDKWLRVHLAPILASPSYRSGSTVVFVTWDEGGMPRHTKICATNTTDQGCHVALLVMNAHVRPGTRWSTLANHYSLLAATEQLLGLPYLGLARTAPSFSRGFRL